MILVPLHLFSILRYLVLIVESHSDFKDVTLVADQIRDSNVAQYTYASPGAFDRKSSSSSAGQPAMVAWMAVPEILQKPANLTRLQIWM
ncbi:hypothetical protein BGX24_009896 [Mortierella sp. AD032]|nr:hypothetical protein BGX24_009896 [Mortierella sp. AD032]